MRVLIAAGLMTLAAGAAHAAADPAFGEWLNADGMGKVTVGPCAGDPALACGAISWVKNPAHTQDVNNPDRALRSHPLVGLLVIRNMKNAGPGRWSGGKLYDPESGKTYNGRIKALSTEKLQVTGCIAFLCESQTWVRAKP